MHEDDDDDGPWIARATFGVPHWFVVVVVALLLLSWIVPGPTDDDVDPVTVSACQDWVTTLNALADGEWTDGEIEARLRAIESEADDAGSQAVRTAAGDAYRTFAEGDVEGFEQASRTFTEACEAALATGRAESG